MRVDGVDVRLVVPGAPASTPGGAPGVPTQPPPPTASPLPRTGVELLAVLLVAVVLLALGTLLVTAGRARHHSQEIS